MSKSQVKGVLIGTVQPNSKPKKPHNKTLEVISQHLGYEIKYVKTLPLKTKDGNELDSFFDETKVIEGDWQINKTLLVRGGMRKRPHSHISPALATKNLKPTASVIVPGLRQEIQQIARMGTHQRLVITPGALTEENYKDSDTGAFGNTEHFYGVVCVEYTSDDFRVFNIQFYEDGSAYHLGHQYFPNGKIKKLSPDEIVRSDGDDHMEERDPVCVKALKDYHKVVRSGIKVSHDTFNGGSISHHEKDNVIDQARKALKGRDCLKTEIQTTVEALEAEEKDFKRVVVVEANHNDFLARYNNSGRWVNDRKNFLPGLITSLAQLHGVNPIKFALAYYESFTSELEKYFKAIEEGKVATIQITSKPRLTKTDFLDEGQSFIFGGVDLGRHGDKGPNGSKGNQKKAETYLGFHVAGHTHTPYLKNRSANGGTTSILDPDYVKGQPSSWLQGCVSIACPKGYDLACLQLILVVNGKWRL